MSHLTIVDLHQEDELSSSSMGEVAGGKDDDRNMTALSTAAQQMTFMMSACDCVIRGIGG